MTKDHQTWSPATANAWAADKPWIIGCNYIPSSAVNFVAMWHRDSFDPATIERELSWARSLGFNTVRVNTNFAIWQADGDEYLARIDQFIALAAAQAISTILVPFDDCEFSGEPPIAAPQPAPVEGLHNSRATSSVGRENTLDRALWPQLQSYCRTLVRRYANDQRVLMWDLYNEPGNRMIFKVDGYAEFDEALEQASLELLDLVFDWARHESPTQPITVGAWHTPEAGSGDTPYCHPADQLALARSDIISFHAYANPVQTQALIDYLKPLGRPLLLSEWMARAVDSRFDNLLPALAAQGVGCINWGLVRGQSQTHLPWPQDLLLKHDIKPKHGQWFHDIFQPDGSPYDEEEVACIRQYALPSAHQRTSA